MPNSLSYLNLSYNPIEYFLNKYKKYFNFLNNIKFFDIEQEIKNHIKYKIKPIINLLPEPYLINNIVNFLY